MFGVLVCSATIAIVTACTDK
ncbi:hypothetical protein [Lentibacillus sp. CBA3610]